MSTGIREGIIDTCRERHTTARIPYRLSHLIRPIPYPGWGSVWVRDKRGWGETAIPVKRTILPVVTIPSYLAINGGKQG